MHGQLLYFPTIGIPDGSWLRKVILYWDTVASITTREVMDGQVRKSAVDTLEKYGAYRPFWLEDIGGQDTLRLIDEEIKVVASGLYGGRLKAVKNLNFSMVHYGKLNVLRRDTVRELERDGLLHAPDYDAPTTNRDWARMHPTLANALLTVLAKLLAANANRITIPCTDNKSCIKWANRLKCPALEHAEGDIRVARLSMLKVLPYPESYVSLEQILRFREKTGNRVLLEGFRDEIDSITKEFAKVKSERQAEKLANKLAKTIKGRTKALSKRMLSENMGYSLGTVSTFLNTRSSPLLAAAAGYAFGLPVEFVLAGATVLAGIQFGIDKAKWNIREKHMLQDHPYAYLVQAQKELGIQFPPN